jgi:hypothetical protein
MRSIEHLQGYYTSLVPPGTQLPDPGDDAAWTRAVLDKIDPARLPDLVARTIAAGAWNCPTLDVYDREAPELHAAAALEQDTPWLAYLPAAVRASWHHSWNAVTPTPATTATARDDLVERGRVFAALAAGGAPFLVGTDTGLPWVIPGDALHRELEYLVAAGVPRARVLRAATADAWRYLEQPHEAGVVQVGARADLLLLDRDPLIVALPAIPDGVMVRGRWLTHDELQHGLDELNRHDAPPSAHWAATPLPGATGAPAVYDVALAGTPVIGERFAAVVGRERMITGQRFEPEEDVETSYQLAPERGIATVNATYHTMTLTVTAAPSAGALVVTGHDLAGAPVSLHAARPAGTMLSLPGLATSAALLPQLARLAPGARRTIAALELAVYPALAIAPVRYKLTRRADDAGHRVYSVETVRGAGASASSVTSELTVDRDGSLLKVADGAPADTVATLRR